MAQQKMKMSPEAQIVMLADFILSLECQYPRADAEHPNGMSAVEAAQAYILELREENAKLREERDQARALCAAFVMNENPDDELIGDLRAQADQILNERDALQKRINDLTREVQAATDHHAYSMALIEEAIGAENMKDRMTFRAMARALDIKDIREERDALKRQVQALERRIAELERENQALRKEGLDMLDHWHLEKDLLIARAERAEAWVMEGGALATMDYLRDKLRQAEAERDALQRQAQALATALLPVARWSETVYESQGDDEIKDIWLKIKDIRVAHDALDEARQAGLVAEGEKQ